VIAFDTFGNCPGLLAEVGGGTGGGLTLLGTHLLAAIAFSVVGIAVLVTCFMIIKRMLPFSVTKEIEEDQNVALAIIIASVILGLSIIIAAAILG
jgi:putative membrane protein